MTKHVFVTGGVVSSLGKGITASSLARLLKDRGLSVSLQKLDPYLNIDPGTLNPGEHGEVFVTEDGAEVDLDLGHYERFTGLSLTRHSSVTSGSIYREVLAAERRGEYNGKTVQVIPHITDAIKARIRALAQGPTPPDVVITEVGGTVGDIESLPFLEAIRQLRGDCGRDESGRPNVCYIHVTLVPYLEASREQKTKPTQHSVSELRARGVTPDIIVARSERPLELGIKEKISRMCDVEPAAVVTAINDQLYRIPLNLHLEGLDDYLCSLLGLADTPPDLAAWQHLVTTVEQAVTSSSPPLRVGIAGKYALQADAYLSIIEACRHAGFANAITVEPVVFSTDEYDAAAPGTLDESSLCHRLANLDAIVIPGGFGARGFEGKVAVARYARENGIPTLGLCLGLHVMVVDVARNLAMLPGANSVEMDPHSPYKVIDLMLSQHDVDELGGTMRLGAYPAKLEPGSVVACAYGATWVSERHRHRYEVADGYRASLADAGLLASGTSPDGRLVEFVELTGHPFFVATQAHPEFKSRPDCPHPLFLALVSAALDARSTR